MNYNLTPQRTYNLYKGRNEHPIDYGTLNNFNQLEINESQNGEKMFDILDEIDKNIKEAEQNILETNKIQNMYNQKNMENLRRLRQNHINNNKISYNFQKGSFQTDKDFHFDDRKLQYDSPVRITHSDFNVQESIQKDNITNNNPKIITKINKYNYNKFKTSNNSRYEENSKTQEYLNQQNTKNIPRGYIKRTKSATYNHFNKSKNNMNISISTSNYENKKKLNKFSNQEMEKLIEDIKAIKLKNQTLLIENKTLNDAYNKMKTIFQNEIRAKESEIKNLKEENQKLKNIDNNKIQKDNKPNKKIRPKVDVNSDEFRNKDRKDIFAYLEYLQDDYDRIFDDNIKLFEDRKELIEKLKTKEDTLEQYHQLLEEVKQLNEENYNIKSKNISLNNDNINLAQKAKKLENEISNIQKIDDELKIKLDVLIEDNKKKEIIIEEITEKLKHAKIENENIKFKFENHQSITDKDFNQMKEQIEALKLKCIKCENLEEQNEKLILSKKQKDIEINDLNNLIKKLKKEMSKNSDEDNKAEEENNKDNINSSSNNELNKKLDEQQEKIEKLKLENQKLNNNLNITREKLTKFEASLESKKLLMNKYYSDKKEIEQFKKEKEDYNNNIKDLKEKIKELEKRNNDLREIIKHLKKKK